MRTDTPGDTTCEDPYAVILELAERGLELASSGELQGLLQLSERFTEVATGLPDQPPPAAWLRLRRAAAIQRHTHDQLMRLREALVGDLERTAQASRAASGYARNLVRRQRIDHSA